MTNLIELYRLLLIVIIFGLIFIYININTLRVSYIYEKNLWNKVEDTKVIKRYYITSILVSLQVWCYILLSVYFFFNIWNYFFDFDKEDMKEKDYANVWILKYSKIFDFIFYIWIIDIGIIFYVYFLVGLFVFEFMNWILIISLCLILIFVLNGFYVVCKYFLRK